MYNINTLPLAQFIHVYICIRMYIHGQSYLIVKATTPAMEMTREDVQYKYAPARPIYTCIHMYTYVYTWSKLSYCESNNASHGNDKRGYREATETPREATEAPRRPCRSPLSPTKATEIIAKTTLQIPAF